LPGRVAARAGGFRILSFYLSEGFPVFLIGAFAKNQKANLSQAERTAISARLRAMAEAYAKKDSER
jgi:hypothetical protein